MSMEGVEAGGVAVGDNENEYLLFVETLSCEKRQITEPHNRSCLDMNIDADEAVTVAVRGDENEMPAFNETPCEKRQIPESHNQSCLDMNMEGVEAGDNENEHPSLVETPTCEKRRFPATQISESEKKYRQELFPDIKAICDKNLCCTACGKNINMNKLKGQPIVHPILGTLICNKCINFYGDGEFSCDEDGSAKYCRWCGQGGMLYLCSLCLAGFCKGCVKRNIPKEIQIEIEKDEWICYSCDVSPLYELRAQCWAAQEYAALPVKDKGRSCAKKSSRNADSRIIEKTCHKEIQKKDLKHTSNEEKNYSDKNNETDVIPKKIYKNCPSYNSDSASESQSKDFDQDKIEDAVKILSNSVSSVIKLTKEVRVKLKKCKKKRLRRKKVKDLKSIFRVKDILTSIMSSYEANVFGVRKELGRYLDEWKQSLTVKNDGKEALVNNKKQINF